MRRVLASLSLLCLCLVFASSAHAIIWTGLAGDGLWSTGGNWGGGSPPNGSGVEANFGVLEDITADQLVTLDSSRTVGALVFGDLTPSHNWTIDGVTSGSILTLAATATPTITVTNQTATINAVLAGTQGMKKLGDGILVLGAAPTFTTIKTIDIAAGTLQLASGVTLATDYVLNFSGQGSGTSTSTFDLGGNTTQTLKNITFTTAANETKNAVFTNGQLTITAVGAAFNVGSNVAGSKQVLDLRGLSKFTFNDSARDFDVSGRNAVGTTTFSTGEAFLSATENVITAAKFRIASVSADSGGATRNVGLVHLGQTNTINASTIDIAPVQRADATLDFQTGLSNPSLRLRGTAGGENDRVANMYIANSLAGNTTNQANATVDLTGGTVDAKVTNLYVGRSVGAASTHPGGLPTGTLTVAGGTFDATTVYLGWSANVEYTGTGGAQTGTLNITGGTFIGGTMELARNSAKGGSGLITGTVNLTGGILNVGTLVLVNKMGTANPAAMTANVVIEGGTLQAQTVNKGTDTSGVNTRNFKFISGTIQSHASNTTFQTGVDIALDSAGTHSFLVDLSRTITVNSVIKDFAPGAGGIVKNGDGTLVLANANTFTGTTRIALGTIQLTNPAGLALAGSTLDWNTTDTGTLSIGSASAITLGGLTGNKEFVVQNDTAGALNLSVGNNNFDTTYTGVLSGSGTLTKIGTGTLTLTPTAQHTLAGGIDVDGGTLVIGNSNAIPAAGVNLGVAGGVGFLTGLTQTELDSISTAALGSVNMLTDSSASLDFSAFADLRLGTAGDHTYSGTITPHATGYKLGGSGGVLTVTSLLGGTASLTVGGGPVSLTNAANSFSGPLVVNNGGVLLLDSIADASTPSALGTPSAGNEAITLNNGTLRYIGTDPLGHATDRAVNLTATGTLEASGAGLLRFTNATAAVTGTGNLTLAGTGSGEIAGPIATGAGTVTVNAGTWTLSGTNTYTGKTFVNAGATLKVAADANLGAAPGSAMNGQLTLDGGTLNATGTLAFDANRGLTFGATASTIAVDASQTLTLAGPIDGAGDWTKTGTGRLILSGPYTATGAITLPDSPAGGILDIRTSIPTGTALITANTNTGTIELNGSAGSITIGRPISLTGGANVYGATLRNVAGNNVISGAVTLGAGSGVSPSIYAAAGTSLTFQSTIKPTTTSDRSVTFLGDGDFVLQGGVQNNTKYVNLVKEGAGTLTTSGPNNYTGATNLTGGHIIALQSAGTPVGRGNITLATNTSLTFKPDGTGGVVTLTAASFDTNAKLNLNENNRVVLDKNGNTSLKITFGHASSTGALSVATTGYVYIEPKFGTANLGSAESILFVARPANAYSPRIIGQDTDGKYDFLVYNTTSGMLRATYAAGFDSGSAVEFASIAAPTTLSSSEQVYALRVDDVLTLDPSVGVTVLNTYGAAEEGVILNGGTITGGTDSSLAFAAKQAIFQVSGTGTLATKITTTAGIRKLGDGTMVISAAQAYSGATVVDLGTLQVDGDVLPDAGAVKIGKYGTLRLNANETIGSLADSATAGGTVDIDGHLLAVGAANTSTTYSGAINGTTGSLTKVGTGRLTLTGVNTYAGATTIAGGQLRADGAALPGSLLVLDGGTLDLAANFTRALGGSSGQVRFGPGAGGFSAMAAGVQVNIGDSATPDTLTWGVGDFAPSALVINDTTATQAIEWRNPLDFGGSNRTIRVGANVATLTGAITEGSGPAGLVKEGAGTLVLTVANNLTGPSTITGGLVQISAFDQLGPAPAAFNAAQLTLNGGGVATTTDLTWQANRGITLGTSDGTLDVAGGTTLGVPVVIAGPAGADLHKKGEGNLLLSAANTYGGKTFIEAGTVTLAGGNAIPDGSIVVFGSAAGMVLDLNGFDETIGGMDNNPDAPANPGEIRLGGNTLTLNVTVDTTSWNAITGAGNLVKTGTAFQGIGGTLSYTGTTTVLGGMLNLSGPGSARATSSFAVSGGGVLRTSSEYSINSDPAGRIGDETPITLNRGILSMIGHATAGPAIEDVGAITLAGFHNTFTLDARAGGVTRLSANSLTRQNGATALVRGPALGAADGGSVAQLQFDAPPTLTAVGGQGTPQVGIIPYLVGDNNATAGVGTDLVTYVAVTDGGYGLRMLVTDEYAVDFTNAGDNVKLVGDAAVDVNRTSGGLAMVNATGSDINLTVNEFQTLTVAGGALLSTNGGTGTMANKIIGTGTLTFGNATTGYEGILHATSANLQIDAVIADNGANVSLTKQGAKHLTLAGPNTYSGITRVNYGRLYANNATALGASGSAANGTVVAANAAVLIGVDSLDEWFTLNGTAVSGEGALRIEGGGRNVTLGGQITLNADSQINVVDATSVLTLSGPVTGAGGLIKDGSGHLILTGLNTFTGPLLTNVNSSSISGDIVVRARQGEGLPNAAPVLLQNGGVLEVWNTGGTAFTRSLGTAAGNIRWVTGGGISAFGGKVTVNINGDGSTLAWDQPNFVSGNSSLFLNSSIADSETDLANGLDISATTPGSVRRVKVNNNPNATTDFATISGKITGNANGYLEKELAGTLVLTNSDNDYAGGTQILAGTLLVNNADTSGAHSGTGSGPVTVNGGATLGGIGSIAGAVTVNGTLSAAEVGTVGTLAINNALTLYGNVVVDIDSPSSYDRIEGVTSMAYGGTLTIPSVAAGSYNLNLFDFSAGSQWGSFTFALPSNVTDYSFNYEEGTLLMTATSVSTTRTWIGGTGSPNLLGDGANWQDSVAPSPGDNVVFGSLGTTNLVPNTGSGIAVGNVTFDVNPSGSYNVEGTGPLTIGGTIQANADATISAPVAGTLGLTKNGPAKVTLAATSNSYTGDTVVNAGILQVNAGVDSNGAGNDNTTVGDGANTATLITEHVRQDTLTINAGSTVTINTTGGASGTSVVNFLRISNGTDFDWSAGVADAASVGGGASDAGSVANAVPEPATWLLAIVAALAGLAAWRRRR